MWAVNASCGFSTPPSRRLIAAAPQHMVLPRNYKDCHQKPCFCYIGFTIIRVQVDQMRDDCFCFCNKNTRNKNIHRRCLLDCLTVWVKNNIETRKYQNPPISGNPVISVTRSRLPSLELHPLTNISGKVRGIYNDTLPLICYSLRGS